LPDSSWYKIPKRWKIYQMTTKYTKWPQNIPNDHKIYQMITKYTNWPQDIPNYKNIPKDKKSIKWLHNIPIDHKIYQMSVKYMYTKIFHCKTLQNLSKLGFLVWKQTIWKPWLEPEKILWSEIFCFRLWNCLI
jgi:hypothetical protein